MARLPFVSGLLAVTLLSACTHAEPADTCLIARMICPQ